MKPQSTIHSARFRRPSLYPHALLIACFFAAAALCAGAAASGGSVAVDPAAGDDSLCSTTRLCRTIAYAVQLDNVSRVNLSSGFFGESTVNITNAPSLVISGAASATVFDCSRRVGPNIGPAFLIRNSTVTFSGITFQNCSNPNGNGGALSAEGSGMHVKHCRFINCSASSGGALSSSSLSPGLFLRVENSAFTRNTALGASFGCPSAPLSHQPCSSWGGAIAAFEIVAVALSFCTFEDNIAAAAVPEASLQWSRSQNAVAGGGGVSVLFRGNASGAKVMVSGCSFLRCKVDVSTSRGVMTGNGRSPLLWLLTFNFLFPVNECVFSMLLN
jgi:hypothetical protein